MAPRGKTAIVTGGSRGIGFAIAKRLTEAGVKTVITGRDSVRLQQAAEQLGAIPVVWDVAQISQRESRFEHCVTALGGCDILVNNAGVFDPVGWGTGALELTEAQWDDVMDVNLKAAFFLMQTAANYMLRVKCRGNILNISSVAALEPYYGPYPVSKGGLYGLTRGWGRMLAPYGIVVNGIGPGPAATDMNNWHEGDTLDHPRIPTGRFLLADEAASLAMYLLSEEACQIVGHTVICDGAYDIK